MNKKRIAVGMLLFLGLWSGFWFLAKHLTLDLMASLPANTVPEYEKNMVYREGVASQNGVAITCNVDWGEEYIPEILEICKENQIKITFFVSGKWAEKNPKLLREMYVAGHDIQNHGYGHKMSSKLTPVSLKEEILKTQNAVEEYLGIKTDIFAPPSGDYNKSTVEVCKDLNYVISLWSADTIDWKEGSTAAVITERILSKDLQRGIILMHPKEETVKALPDILAGIQKQNIEVIPLKKLIGIE